MFPSHRRSGSKTDSGWLGSSEESPQSAENRGFAAPGATGGLSARVFKRVPTRTGGQAASGTHFQWALSEAICGHTVSRARGLTLAELMMAMVVMSILSVVLGGLVLAVQTARQHSEGLDAATAQAQSTMDRIRHMVSQAGVYRVDGQPTRLGLAVVAQQFATEKVPNVLVVWSGGRNGGMSAAGVQTRLPKVNELVIYAADPSDPGRLVEINDPTDTSSIDFADAGFDARILTLIRSPSAEQILLCDRIRVVREPAFNLDGNGTGTTWFELQLTPGDADLDAAPPRTEEWIQLGWAQGIVSSGRGLRQATVRIELQLERLSAVSSSSGSRSSAIPFFGSASCRYVYEP